MGGHLISNEVRGRGRKGGKGKERKEQEGGGRRERGKRERRGGVSCILDLVPQN